MLLDLNLEVNVLLESGFDLIGGELCKSFFEEVDLQLDIKVFLL